MLFAQIGSLVGVTQSTPTPPEVRNPTHKTLPPGSRPVVPGGVPDFLPGLLASQNEGMTARFL